MRAFDATHDISNYIQDIQEMQQEQKKIASNTIYLSIRMIVLMLVTLYTSRITLLALGVSDFGVYNIVAGVVTLFAFFNSSLVNVSQRFLNLAIASRDCKLLETTFRQIFTVLLLFAALLWLGAETIGKTMIFENLVVPADRHNAAIWVYRTSVVSAVVTVLQIGFVALIVSHEEMKVYAYFSMIEALMRLLVAFCVLHSSGDRLILYCCVCCLSTLLSFLFHVVYCRMKYPMCVLVPVWGKREVNSMLAFMSGNIYGCIAWAIGTQGINVVLNVFFGPIANAAKGISTQLSSVVSRFIDSATTAVKPQLIQSYAVGDVEKTREITYFTSRFVLLLSIIMCIPLLLETKAILELWLFDVPEHAIWFTRICAVDSIISAIISPLWMCANATGDIKRNQIVGRTFTLLALPIAYGCLQIIPIPEVALIVMLLVNACYWGYCVWDINKQVGMNIALYVRGIVLPLGLCMIYIALLIIMSLIWGHQIESIWGRLTCLIIVEFIFILCAYVSLEVREKEYVKNVLFKNWIK